MSARKTFISISITSTELEKIRYLKTHTDANTKAAVLRKGLYFLFEQVKQQENNRRLETSPVEG
ncbi:MAG: hypothetical protein PHV82_14040 [Victivallaceae bacterium]|nr:hypothetical protein [Victivallaceae bacterium]